MGKNSNTVGARIIVGVDRSIAAARAVRAIGMRAWPSGTEVRLIVVNDGSPHTKKADVPPSLEALVTSCNGGPPVNAHLMAEGAWAVFDAEGLSASVEIMEGDPRRALGEKARQWKADCIFVGSRGLGGAAEHLGLGSVAAFVGAGPSQGAGLPNWPGLLRQMLDWAQAHGINISDPSEFEGYIEGDDLLLAAEELQERMGDELFRKFMAEVFRQPDLEPTETHLLIPRVPFAAPPAKITAQRPELL